MSLSASFAWEQLLSVAEELAQRAEESYLRTAIGRAYYYALHLARKRLIANGFHFIENTESHIQVWDPFKKSPHPQIKAIGDLGTALKVKRNHADYRETAYPRIRDDAKSVVETAKLFARKLELLLRTYRVMSLESGRSLTFVQTPANPVFYSATLRKRRSSPFIWAGCSKPRMPSSVGAISFNAPVGCKRTGSLLI